MIEGIQDREGWPEGDCNRPHRLFSIRLVDQLDNVNLTHLLQLVMKVLQGTESVSKATRFNLGQHLASVLDRMIEFQELYDRTIPRNIEYNADLNPQRTEHGLLLNMEVNFSQLPDIMEALVERETPFPLTDIFPSAEPKDQILSVQRLRVIFLSKTIINVSCVMKVLRWVGV